MAELRDVNIQRDSMRFRRNLERLGEIFAYEISKKMEYKDVDIETPLGVAHLKVLSKQPVLATILRAGLPLYRGLHNYFDRAENAFVSAYRKYDSDGEFIIKLDYISSPSIQDKVLIISDPMLATGGSLIASLKGLFEKGQPSHTHIVSVLSCDEGIENLKKSFSLKNITIWTGSIDDELTAKAYIVPGLGDAGDLAFGQKDD
jgi:uracil phosphoribosyltransferase